MMAISTARESAGSQSLSESGEWIMRGDLDGEARQATVLRPRTARERRSEGRRLEPSVWLVGPSPLCDAHRDHCVCDVLGGRVIGTSPAIPQSLAGIPPLLAVPRQGDCRNRLERRQPKAKRRVAE